MSDAEYNGWSNRETWAANLHMSNDQGWYLKGLEAVAEVKKKGYVDGRFALADALEEVFNDFLADADMPFEFEVNVLRDVGSLWRVDWVEIAEGWMEE